MKRMAKRILTSSVMLTALSWIVPVAAHAGQNLNHNETLVRAR